MPRVIVPAAEEIIGKEFKCLNLGHVQLVDYMGGDYSVAQAARTSYATKAWGDGTGFLDPKDVGLVNYLMAHRHSTPFEMLQIKLRMKMPLFIARQLIRHRTVSVNEVSARYTKLPDDFYVPEPENVNFQSTENKQGRGGTFELEEAMREIDLIKSEQAHAYAAYEGRISRGMAKELARVNLPLSIYTEWYWDQNLWNMLHMLSLRMDSHAQYEIRVYANAIHEILMAVAPSCVRAWEEHFFNARKFSWTEMQVLGTFISNWHKDDTNQQALLEEAKKVLSGRALDEFKSKIFLGDK